MAPVTPAGIVADALAHAEATAGIGYYPTRFCVVHLNRAIDTAPDWEDTTPESISNGDGGQGVAYARADFMLAALAHAAERCARAEERASRLRKSLDDVMYAICENALRDEGEHAGAVCKRAIEADKAVLRG